MESVSPYEETYLKYNMIVANLFILHSSKRKNLESVEDIFRL